MKEREKYDKIYLGDLLAYYETFLSAKQREYVTLYYQEDYSLHEIAQLYHVTRAGVHQQIQQAQKKMIALEAQLHMRQMSQDILPALEKGIAGKDWQMIQDNVKKLKEIIRETE